MATDLERFVEAQAANYETALAELRKGRKTSHWMWFIFPQIAGLGRSSMSQRYAITSLDEARSFLQHPTLGPRLRVCAEAVLAARAGSIEEVFSSVDAMKLRSSMTLFHRAAPEDQLFSGVLDRWFAGAPAPATDGVLAAT